MFCLFKIYSWPSSSFLLILLTILAALLRFGNASVTTIFIFGDSTVDPGNNNYINTMFKANFSPYGYDFVNKTPTGRFTDGLLVTDFIASYAGLKQTVPAYLDPKLSLDDLITGVSFASAGSGYDPATPAKLGVLSLSKQLEYFDEYKQKVEEMIGKERAEEIVENAVYVISAGTNDFVFTLGLLEENLMFLTAPAYMQFILDQCKSFVQDLMQRGPRKIAVVSVAPVGCLPIVITFHTQDQLFLHEEQPQKSSSRSCIDPLSKVTTDFNQMLEAEIKMMQDSHPNDLLAYADIYGPLFDQIKNPHKYGFEVVDRGCCGSGTLEGGYLCNSESQICKDLSKHLFWDSIHPTQRSYKFLFEALRPIVDEYIQYSN